MSGLALLGFLGGSCLALLRFGSLARASGSPSGSSHLVMSASARLGRSVLPMRQPFVLGAWYCQIVVIEALCAFINICTLSITAWSSGAMGHTQLTRWHDKRRVEASRRVIEPSSAILCAAAKGETPVDDDENARGAPTDKKISMFMAPLTSEKIPAASVDSISGRHQEANARNQIREVCDRLAGDRGATRAAGAQTESTPAGGDELDPTTVNVCVVGRRMQIIHTNMTNTSRAQKIKRRAKTLSNMVQSEHEYGRSP
ncbi:unnamed protein product [Prorocentrum cordatum]|uniref:Uncharacterized protein n=1 Tax=Prorocentrum cordatum TaxID=2364126 RepID=A0ABN9QQD1_9DINO|nr:unnamed protein product [Polarella glacialis]